MQVRHDKIRFDETMTTRTSKLATATRIDGDIYDVTYPGHADMDKNVHYSYLRRLARDGYTVTVEQHSHRGDGDPSSYVVNPND